MRRYWDTEWMLLPSSTVFNKNAWTVYLIGLGVLLQLGQFLMYESRWIGGGSLLFEQLVQLTETPRATTGVSGLCTWRLHIQGPRGGCFDAAICQTIVVRHSSVTWSAEGILWSNGGWLTTLNHVLWRGLQLIIARTGTICFWFTIHSSVGKQVRPLTRIPQFRANLRLVITTYLWQYLASASGVRGFLIDWWSGAYFISMKKSMWIMWITRHFTQALEFMQLLVRKTVVAFVFLNICDTPGSCW